MRHHNVNMAWHDKLKHARDKRYLSDTRIGKALKASQPTVSAWMNGKHEPKLGIGLRLCKLLEIDPEWVYDDSKPDTGPDKITQALVAEVEKLGPKEALRRLLADSSQSGAGEWAQDLGAVDLPQAISHHKKADGPNHPAITGSLVPPPKTSGSPPEIQLGHLPAKVEPLDPPKRKRKP